MYLVQTEVFMREDWCLNCVSISCGVYLLASFFRTLLCVSCLWGCVSCMWGRVCRVCEVVCHVCTVLCVVYVNCCVSCMWGVVCHVRCCVSCMWGVLCLAYAQWAASAKGRYICTHCNTLHHTAQHWKKCSTLFHIAPHCNAMQHTAKQVSHHTRNWWWVLQADVCVHTAPHCTTIHHTAPHCSTLQHRYHIIHGIGGECYRQMCVYTLHYTVPHCTTLHHTDQTAPYCNTDITSYTEWAASAGMRVSRVWCCRCRVGVGSRASRGRKPFDLGGPPRYGKYPQTWY